MRRKSIIFILSLTVLLSLVFVWLEQKPRSVRAYGHLSVDMGVPSGEPIFVINNFLPGDCVVRNITVTNDDTLPIETAVRSDNETFTNNLPDVLAITISENGNTLYQQILTQFFTDSESLDGIPLSTLNPNQTKTYDFKICFNSNAGNEYQNAQTIFDLIFGEVISPITLPAECSHLQGIITQKIEGTAGKDKLRGTSADELIIGNGGNDEITGGSGRDCIVGGDGNDKLEGGSGDDIILGYGGNDDIDGGSGDDVIYAGAGNDKIKGGSGDDYILGGDGNDDIEGQSGDDLMNGGNGNDKINGASGKDTCQEGENLTSCEL